MIEISQQRIKIFDLYIGFY